MNNVPQAIAVAAALPLLPAPRAAGGVDDRLAGVEGSVGGDGDHLGAGVDVGGEFVVIHSYLIV